MMQMRINILMLAMVSELNNKAIEKFFDLNYSNNNILIYTHKLVNGKLCRFCPRINSDNLFLEEDFRSYLFNDIRGFEEFHPIDENLLVKLNPFEGEIYRQMSRIFPPLKSFDERQRCYYNAVRFFNGLLEKNNIGLYILYGVPHQMYDFVLYALCKVKNIPVRMLYHTPIRQYTYYFDDIREHGFLFKKYQNCTYDTLPSDFKKIYNLFQNYSDNHNLYKIYKYGKINYLIKRVNALKKYPAKAVLIAIRNELRLKAKKIYIGEIAKEPQKGYKYIYFPLHVQPEATTSPMAGKYCSQELAIEMLSYYLPDNWYIYVKEHPDQGSRGEKNIRFFKELNRLPNVRIVPTKYSSIELIKNCNAVATCTGTVAFESMFMKKPAILFGHSIYNYRPGAFYINSVDECKKCLMEIEQGVKITDLEITSYLYSISQMFHKVLWGSDFTYEEIEKFGISIEENNNNTFLLLIEILQSI